MTPDQDTPGPAADPAATNAPTDPTPTDPGTTDPAPVRTPSARLCRLLVVVAVAVGFGLDQLSKRQALAGLDPDQPVRLLGGLLTLRLIFNPGAAFGLGQGATVLFTGLSVAVLLVVALAVVPRVRHRGWAVALGLLLAGVCGNLTDRLVRPPGVFRGHVVDFLQIPHFPAIFNVADICVTSAAILIAVLSLFGRVGMNGQPVQAAGTGENRS